MKIAALLILTMITLRQALRTMFIKKDKEMDKLAYMLFSTTVFYLMILGAI